MGHARRPQIFKEKTKTSAGIAACSDGTEPNRRERVARLVELEISDDELRGLHVVALATT